MSPLLDVVIIACRCEKLGRGFGVRMEQTAPAAWSADWAFPLDEQTARREGFDRAEIRGQFTLAGAYPGCPHCAAGSIVRCGCGKVDCWDGRTQTVVCAWCGQTGTISGGIDRLAAGGDR